MKKNIKQSLIFLMRLEYSLNQKVVRINRSSNTFKRNKFIIEKLKIKFLIFTYILLVFFLKISQIISITITAPIVILYQEWQIKLQLNRQQQMSRKQKRLQIIQYFLKISQSQQEVQNIQNELISHIRFNPLIIYRRISGGITPIKQEQLISYISKNCSLNDRTIINKYMKKHKFQETIQLEEFSSSILPYTPNVLRETSEKIQKQMQTKHLDRVIQSLYHKILEIQLKNIYEISLFQQQIHMDWSQLNKFLEKDLRQKGRKIDNQPSQECGIITIRKWLQLWIDIEEFKILNLIRWLGGYEQSSIKGYYSMNNTHLKCTCHGSLAEQSNLKNDGRLKKVKSENSLVYEINTYLEHFLKYIETIIKSQRRLQLLRESLRPYKRQVQMVLHQIASKKSNFTKLGKIVTQLEQVLKIKSDMAYKLHTELQNSKIDNNILFSLFVCSSKTTNNAHKLSREEIINEIYETLYTFCLTKATLKSISREILSGIQAIFQELDENRHKFIDSTDLRLFLKAEKITHKEKDINILMNHFGNGEKITYNSFKEVFGIQINS